MGKRSSVVALVSEGTRFWGGPGSEGVAKTQVINTESVIGDLVEEQKV